MSPTRTRQIGGAPHRLPRAIQLARDSVEFHATTSGIVFSFSAGRQPTGELLSRFSGRSPQSCMSALRAAAGNSRHGLTLVRS